MRDSICQVIWCFQPKSTIQPGICSLAVGLTVTRPQALGFSLPTLMDLVGDDYLLYR